MRLQRRSAFDAFGLRIDETLKAFVGEVQRATERVRQTIEQLIEEITETKRGVVGGTAFDGDSR